MSNTKANPPRHLARQMLAAVAVIATLAASLALPAHAQNTPGETAEKEGPLTRAEVIADFALWRRAGVDRYDVLAHSYGLEKEAYHAAYQEYLRLRSSDQFQLEVQKALNK
ncbi:DUF4148 domain-containing protein [Acidovorax sp. NCPPB 3576]|uniref:DUF4148 domain-containing protein n=1 Tax=Acidovorax sp. NCPPB 3576 TaxID=2940488 RepID=UPI00234ACFC5|nr:DUF4148 domain-containing protein [Acidovorax sp. NCPPB 3576]WCM89471.1 DUF4148 domain-containing protein [Acidovorax sp. NCPPB 3576]